MHKFYNPVEIRPPVWPDSAGVPSDHFVPFTYPISSLKNDRKTKSKNITFRPIPDSKLYAFGNLIMSENWASILNNSDLPSVQVENFQKILNGKVDFHFPVKTFKKGPDDIPWLHKND